MTRTAIVLSACLWLLVTVAPCAAAEYRLVDLGPGTAEGLDNAGTVVGGTDANEQLRQAAILSPSVTLIHIGQANAVAGPEVVGDARVGPLNQFAHGFTWNATDGFRDLGTLGGESMFSTAQAVNSTLTTAGWASAPDGSATAYPVVWVMEQISQLPTLGGPSGYVQAMNVYGDLVGSSDTATGAHHAALWPVEGGVVDLDPGQARASFATAINASRTIVGLTFFPATGMLPASFRAFRWTATTGFQDLGMLPGHADSGATAINDAGVIVGTSTPPGTSAVPHAVRIAQGVMVDLNTLINAPGWVLRRSTGINNAGQIIGQGAFQGAFHGWLLHPMFIPTPPVALTVQARGDFNGDTFDDLAGLTADSRIFRCVAGAPACTQLPGRAVGLAAIDLNQDGQEDLAAVASDTSLWRLLDGETWERCPGNLVALVAADVGPGGSRLLVGLATDGRMWTSADMTTWQALPYYLADIAAGDYRGVGHDQIAATDYRTTIWFLDSLTQWSILPGNLVTIETVSGTPDGMQGVDYAGGVWLARTLGQWERVH